MAIQKIIHSFKENPYVPVFSTTLILSAFLLFSVQPMFGKMILPVLGGSSAVWNTAMMFFQLVLLAGYAYAHFTSRFLNIRHQAILHILLLGAFLFVLPIALPAGTAPPEGKDPTLWQIGLMFTVVGGPFFALSGTAPILQRWFAKTPHKDADNPYFLYAASNLGSFAALLSYPVIIEPIIGITSQSIHWASCYLVLIGLILLSAGNVWSSAKEKLEEEKKDRSEEIVTWNTRFWWLLLAFVPSSLLLGVTTFITSDIASVPLLWVLPLAAYVGSFVIAFARKEIISYKMTMWLQGFAFSFAIFWMFIQTTTAIFLIAIHLILFTLIALASHINLAKLRPHSSRLTEFYLIVSIGGALGGTFNALVAPNIFSAPIEYPLILTLAAFLRYLGEPGFKLKETFSKTIEVIKGKKDKNFYRTIASLPLIAIVVGASIFALATSGANKSFLYIGLFSTIGILTLVYRRWSFATIVVLAFSAAMLKMWYLDPGILALKRNFYGVYKIIEKPEHKTRYLVSGVTLHGGQPLSDESRLIPVTYYNPNTSCGEAFNFFEKYAPKGEQKVAIIGLGVGSLSCYGDSNRHYDYYEISSLVADIASNDEYFTYLSDCGTSNSIILGDGRIKLAEASNNHYDLIVLDAFSSDSIPVHLLTSEAFLMYKKKLKPNGMIIVHISNKYMDLKPVVTTSARDTGMAAFFKTTASGNIANTDVKYEVAMFGVVTDNKDMLLDLTQNGWIEAKISPNRRSWTDDYANILSVLHAPER